MKYIIILIAISFVVYSGIFQNEFVWDDIDQIVRNDAIKDWGYAPKYFTTDLWKLTARKGSSGYYRPFFLLTLLAEYKIFGLQTWGYHLVSVLLHAASAVLLYLLLLTCFKERWIAFCSSVFFIVCSVSSEAVVFISAQCHPLGLMFFLLTIILFAKYNRMHELDDSQNSQPCVARRARCDRVHLYYLASVLSCLFALFSKEMTITLPAILLLYDYFFIPSRAGAGAEPKENILRWAGRRLKYHLPYIAVTIVYLVLRFSAMGGVRITGAGASVARFISELYPRVLTAVTVYTHYITKLIFPTGLSTVYNFEAPKGLADLKVIASMVILLVIIFLLVRGRKEKALLFGALWFFIALLPASNIIPIPVMVADRYAYIPSAGFCIVAGFLISRFYKWGAVRPSRVLKTSVLFIYIALILFQGVGTFRKNSTWKTAESLWIRTLSIFPSSAVAWNNLGSAYSDKGMLDEATDAYKKAIHYNPNFIEPYTNLANAYSQKGIVDEAFEYYAAALKLKPDSANIHNNLGLIYEQKGDPARAIKEYKQAIDAEPSYWQAYNNLGKVYALMKKYNEAADWFKKAIGIATGGPHGNISEPYINLGGVYIETKQYDKAIIELQKAIEIDPNSREGLTNIGIAYLRKGDKSKATEIFNRLQNPQ